VAGLFSGNGRVATSPGGDANDPFDAPGDVAWSPVKITDWASVPMYNGAKDFPNIVSDPKYHNPENVRLGKGDPCRLVGLNLKNIANPAFKLSAEHIDNGVWRMPTPEENRDFTEYQKTTDTDAHWTTFGGVPGGMFPIGNPGKFLPQTGYRKESGQTYRDGWTDYWSCKPETSTQAYTMVIAPDRIYPTSKAVYHNALIIRCVRQ